MGLSRTVFEIDGDFSQKSQKKFPPLSTLRPRWRGSHCNWVPALAVKKQEWWGYRQTKKFDDIFSRLDRMHERDRQTDGQTDTGPQQRPRLRTASRGNKTFLQAGAALPYEN